MTEIKQEILEILSENALTSPAEMALMLGTNEKAVKTCITELEDDKIIVKYHAVINRDKTDYVGVEALIEVKVTPQRGGGFDTIAKRIYKFDEVRTVYLMSGTYDLLVMVYGENLRNVSGFVSEKLSTLEGVVSTVTHFVLKRYKEDGVIIDDDTDERLVVTP